MRMMMMMMMIMSRKTHARQKTFEEISRLLMNTAFAHGTRPVPICEFLRSFQYQ